ncbi:LysM peptidoglycan-binding domain-containing protein [Hymenobacter metallilatus]|uniref:LysM peptidoglycan-binding domain-containing protein n=1 Tax=Hymenobacter metallilatus TaxID=2493666 RepID=A0A428JQ61_9BACT|nr:LysM peptidoglycan-binding domain-containing protein [Hymenobacter metallilatus]RSK35421.1 LysM peptidoglycan-binding domain-containing protein [Hymenobacter metallilatus]
MKRLVLLVILLLPLLVAAQTLPVPTQLSVAGLRLRLTEGGRTALQQKVDALRRHPASFQARVVLADAYFPIIDRVFQQEGLPLDFHFLALQESGLQGDAQSIHDAVGYWQFKRESAQDFGLLMNEAIDERKHITASSKAAAQYLLRNNKTLRNWANALLSYNLGLTGTKPYTLPTDAGATEMEISEKTHPYILTFLAHKIAFEPAIGLNTKPPLLLQEFPAPAGRPLSVMAQAMQQNPEELAKYNRWLLAPIVPTDRVYTMLVPITDPLQLTALAAQQKNATAGQLLNQPTADPENADFVRVNGLKAVVALPGDTKESLAKRAGVKLRKFMQFNDLFAFDNITAGQPYFVQKKRDKAAVEYHAAQPGESVVTISQKYGIRAKAIWSKNRMARNEELRPGRVLWLQHTRPKNVPVEYADGSNPAALAAFEKPVGASPATPEGGLAVPPTKKKKQDDTEPYMGGTANSSRILEDAVEEDTSTTVVQPDSATDEHTENLNELPPAPAQPATIPAPAATPKPASPLPKKPLPAAAPIADEPAETESAEAEPVASPSTQPVAPAPRINPTPPVTRPAVPATPTPAPVATPAPRPAAPVTPAPVAPPTAVEPVPVSGLHTVQPKENLYSVARRFGLRPADIVLWNNLPQQPALRIGQVLRLTAPDTMAAPLPAPATTAKPTPATAKPALSAPVAAPAEVKHTVQTGETMYSVSRKYGVTIKQIMEWNSKPDFSVKPGEVLLIKPAK